MQRRQFLAAGLGVALAGCAQGSAGLTEDDTDTSGDGDLEVSTSADLDREEIEVRIVAEMDELRQAEHVQTLHHDASLREAAREHSRDMAEREFFGHTNPDGQEPWDRVRCDATENLQGGWHDRTETAAGRTVDGGTVEGVVATTIDGWTESAEHYRNLMDTSVRAVGVGFYSDGQQWFVTAKYC